MLQGCNNEAAHLESGTIFSPGFHLSKNPGGKVVDRGKYHCIISIILSFEFLFLFSMKFSYILKLIFNPFFFFFLFLSS